MQPGLRKTLNKSAEDHLESYDEEMIEDLRELLTGYLDGYTVEDITMMDIEEIVTTWQNNLPDPGQWAGEKAYSEYESHEDARHELMKDENG